ncbi:MAG: NAD-dependent epimerase/dehydratase family protein [Saccharofermentans sp.]|nr:NAD-dependent epimerase/dehydratase family protein [Saccharofermentans sp.]
MKVLIIGGMGLIGGAISRAAVRKQLDVYIVSRRKLFGEWLGGGIHELCGDWKDDSFAKSVVEVGFDVIVDTQIFTEKQLERAVRIIDGHCKHFIYISTDSVYIHPADNIDEDNAINLSELKWKYGYDKRKAELFLFNHGSEYSFMWSVIRPTITFGETRIPVGFSSKRNTYTIAKRIIDGKPIVCFDDMSTRHSVCHESIFGAAAVELFLNESAYNQCYHISDDYSFTYSEIFEAIENVLNVRGIYIKCDTAILKKYSKNIYEEMIYDKNPHFTLNNKKIKSIAPDISFHINIETVMKATLVHLACESNEDQEYNLLTDCILLHVYKSHKTEDTQLAKYIEGLNESYVIQLKKFERQMIIKNMVDIAKGALRPIKRLIMPY